MQKPRIPLSLVVYAGLALATLMVMVLPVGPEVPTNPVLLFCPFGALMIIASKDKKRWYWTTLAFTLIALFLPIFMGWPGWMERPTFMQRQLYYMVPAALLALLVGSRSLWRYAGRPRVLVGQVSGS